MLNDKIFYCRLSIVLTVVDYHHAAVKLSFCSCIVIENYLSNRFMTIILPMKKTQKKLQNVDFAAE